MSPDIIGLFLDEYTPPKVTDPTREHPTVLASNLTPGPHKLDLIATGPPLAALRIHSPPMTEEGGKTQWH